MRAGVLSIGGGIAAVAAAVLLLGAGALQLRADAARLPLADDLRAVKLGDVADVSDEVLQAAPERLARIRAMPLADPEIGREIGIVLLARSARAEGAEQAALFEAAQAAYVSSLGDAPLAYGTWRGLVTATCAREGLTDACFEAMHRALDAATGDFRLQLLVIQLVVANADVAPPDLQRRVWQLVRASEPYPTQWWYIRRLFEGRAVLDAFMASAI